MKTTKEEILHTALALFAERGYDAVSTAMIAERLGITKGALYRHFENKQEIFTAIIDRMFELDAQRAQEDHVPEKEYRDDSASYARTKLEELCSFAVNQFSFWTEDDFASSFRRMITIEQFKSPQAQKLYQDVIVSGPVAYTEELLQCMLGSGELNERAAVLGARSLAMELFAPLQLCIQLSDGGADREELKSRLTALTREFVLQWGK